MDTIRIETDVFEEIHKNLQDKLQNLEDTWLSSKQVQKRHTGING